MLQKRRCRDAEPPAPYETVGPFDSSCYFSRQSKAALTQKEGRRYRDAPMENNPLLPVTRRSRRFRLVALAAEKH